MSTEERDEAARIAAQEETAVKAIKLGLLMSSLRIASENELFPSGLPETARPPLVSAETLEEHQRRYVDAPSAWGSIGTWFSKPTTVVRQAKSSPGPRLPAPPQPPAPPQQPLPPSTGAQAEPPVSREVLEAVSAVDEQPLPEPPELTTDPVATTAENPRVAEFTSAFTANEDYIHHALSSIVHNRIKYLASGTGSETEMLSVMPCRKQLDQVMACYDKQLSRGARCDVLLCARFVEKLQQCTEATDDQHARIDVGTRKKKAPHDTPQQSSS